MRRVRGATTAALVTFIAMLPLLVAGCSGGGGGGGGVSQIIVTITNCDSTTFAASGVICVDFSATGPAGVFDLLAEFIGGPAGPLEGAYEVPPALAMQLGITSDVQNLVLNFDGDVVTGRFCWFAGADLGFVRANGVQFFLTPVADGTTTALGPVESCTGISYDGGGQTSIGTNPPIGALAGRAGQCGENVSGKNIAIAGGYTNNPALTSYDTVDRFTFDTANFTWSKNTSPLVMRDPRTDHACSFFLDPVTEAIKVLITGGADFAGGAGAPATGTADVYCFTPQPDSISSTTGDMNVARRGHTATWIPSNKVVIIGGNNGGTSGAAFDSIELYDPILDSFQLLTSPVLSFARRGHTATLLPTGKILIAGGYDPATPLTANVPLPAELFNPANNTIMTVAGPVVDRVLHTATRLANGWVLLAGGRTVSSNQATVSSSAQIFEPELGGMGQFTTTMPMMTSPRSFHAASLLGSGDTLLTGGDTGAASPFAATLTAELFLYHTLTFTPVIPMAVPRFEHSSNATSCGAIVVIGGRDDFPGSEVFLQSLEIYPFENMNPVVASAFTGSTGLNGSMWINVTVLDADADGGYVIIRFRAPAGTGLFRQATIDQQSPSSAPANFPNMQVGGLPSQALPYSFRWNFAADSLTTGQTAEIEVLPIGATLGTPVRFTVTIP